MTAPATEFSESRFLAVVVLAGVGLGITAPLTVLYAASFGASDLLAGAAVSSIALSLLAVDLFGTKLVPRLDGRTAVWFALVVFGSGSFASAVAPGLAWMIAARVAQGVGAAFFLGGALQVVVRFAGAGEAGRAIGAFNAAWFCGVAVGPALGGLLASQGAGQAGYRLAFAVCGAICLAVALGARLALPPIPSPRPPQLSLPRRAEARPGLRMWPPLTLAAIGQAVRAGAVFTIIPLLGQRELGLRPGAVGLALSGLAVVDIASMRVGGAWADRVGRRVVLAGSLLVGAGVCATLPLVRGPLSFSLWCAAIAVTVGVVWVVPAAVVVDVSVEPEAGLAMYRIGADVGQLTGSTGAGALVGAVGPVGAVLALGVGFASVAGWILRLPETARSRAPTPTPAAATAST